MDFTKKKIYCEPRLDVVVIDREMTLVMASSETNPGGGDIPFPAPPAGASSQETTSRTELQSNPFSTEP